MRRDLATYDTPQFRTTDVAIVGGGIAGFILAKQLADEGISCMLLESGGADETEEDPLYADVNFRRRFYGGASNGRSRCLGGTSVKWGGALLPFQERDFAPRNDPRLPDWPLRYADLALHLEEAERIFGLNHSTYEAVLPIKETSSGFVPREAKWPTFKNRNVTALFHEIAEGSGRVEVWLNATVRAFDIREGTVHQVTASGPEGQTLTVTPQCVVICAGAIETTRLMLLLDAQTEGHEIKGREHLGRYFQDHLSLPLAQIVTTNPLKLNKMFGFRFDGSVMRSLRFEQGITGEIAGFVHVAPRALGKSGFDELRKFMRSIQRRKPDLWGPIRALRDGPYIMRLLWWRVFRSRLLWPAPAEYDVHFVMEQLAVAENRIVLGARVDNLGHRVTEIDWDISEDDVRELTRFSRTFEEFWIDSGLSALGSLVWNTDPPNLKQAEEREIEAIYHPGGTTRMANSPEEGVVDRNLLVFGISNLYLGSTSVFPNGGSANPTMTLILLILRLAAYLKAQRT